MGRKRTKQERLEKARAFNSRQSQTLDISSFLDVLPTVGQEVEVITPRKTIPHAGYSLRVAYVDGGQSYLFDAKVSSLDRPKKGDDVVRVLIGNPVVKKASSSGGLPEMNVSSDAVRGTLSVGSSIYVIGGVVPKGLCSNQRVALTVDEKSYVARYGVGKKDKVSLVLLEETSSV